MDTLIGSIGGVAMSASAVAPPAASHANGTAPTSLHHPQVLDLSWEAMHSWSGQLTVAIFFAVIFTLVFEGFTPMVKQWVTEQPWWATGKEPQKQMLYNFGFPDPQTDEVAASVRKSLTADVLRAGETTIH